AEGQVVEGCVEHAETLSHPLERLRRPLLNLADRLRERRPVRSRPYLPPRRPLGLGEKQIAVPEALHGIEPWELGLPLGLHYLCLAEERQRLGPTADR